MPDEAPDSWVLVEPEREPEEEVAGAAAAAAAATCISQVPAWQVSSFWHHADCAGGYSRLDAPAIAAARAAGIPFKAFDGDAGQAPEARLGIPHLDGPACEIALRFDFIEVAGGAGRVSKYLSEGHSLVVGLVLDLSASRHFNAERMTLVAWLMHMLAIRKLRGVGCEPPCTTFSIFLPDEGVSGRPGSLRAPDALGQSFDVRDPCYPPSRPALRRCRLGGTAADLSRPVPEGMAGVLAEGRGL